MLKSDEKSVDIAFDDSEEEEELEQEERKDVLATHLGKNNGVRTTRSGGKKQLNQMTTEREENGFCILDSPTSVMVVRGHNYCHFLP